MIVELKLKTDIYSQEEKPRIIKRGVVSRISLDTEDIKYPSEVINTRGNVLKNEVKINVRDIGPMIVNHSYAYIQKLLKSAEPKRITVKGFRK